MYSPLFLLFLLCVLFNFCSATKVQKKVEKAQLQLPQCNYDTSSLQITTSVPVFNPFDSDGNVDEAKIMIYAKILQKRGISGVRLLTEEVGSDLLDVNSKIKVIRGWYTAKEKTGFPETILCLVGGINVNQTIQLAKYAAKRCDGITLREIIDYPVPTIRDYVNCVKVVADAVYPTPVFVSELLYPTSLGDLNSAKRFALLNKNIKNFRGYIAKLDRLLEIKAVNDLSPNKILIADDSVDVVTPLAYCINGTSTLVANVCPECIVAIRRAYYKGDLARCIRIQEKLNTFFVSAVGLKYNPDRLDRSLLGYIIEVTKALVNRRLGLDLGGPSGCSKLSDQDTRRINDLCEEDDFGIYSNGDDQYATTGYSNEDQDSYTKSYSNTKKNKGKYGIDDA